MELVEETASYLDGEGRQESKLLSRNAALAYAAESMRLTTRLMQVASWLLVQRAVREGDMAPGRRLRGPLSPERRGRRPRGRGRPARGELPRGLPAWPTAPSASTSASATWTGACTWRARRPNRANPVLAQLDRLKTAFGG